MVLIRNLCLLFGAVVLCSGVVVPSVNPICPTTDLKRLRTDLSSYIDLVLGTLRLKLIDHGYDRVSLPGSTGSFSRPFLGVTWHGEAAAKNGTLMGVETIQRNGLAHVNYTDDEIRFSTDIGFKSLNLTYHLKAQFMGFGPDARIVGNMDGIGCYLSAKTSREFPVKVTLEDFKLRNVGKVKFEVQGLGLDTLKELVTNGIQEQLGNVVKFFFGQLVETSIKDMLNNTMSVTSLPPDALCYFI